MVGRNPAIQAITCCLHIHRRLDLEVVPRLECKHVSVRCGHPKCPHLAAMLNGHPMDVFWLGCVSGALASPHHVLTSQHPGPSQSSPYIHSSWSRDSARGIAAIQHQSVRWWKADSHQWGKRKKWVEILYCLWDIYIPGVRENTPNTRQSGSILSKKKVNYIGFPEPKIHNQ